MLTDIAIGAVMGVIFSAAGKVLSGAYRGTLTLAHKAGQVIDIKSFNVPYKITVKQLRLGVVGFDQNELGMFIVALEKIEVDKLASNFSAPKANAIKRTKNLLDVVDPSLRLGNTGRQLKDATNLKETLAMKSAMSGDFDKGKWLDNIPMNDPIWLGTNGWRKYEKIYQTIDGQQIIIHYNYNINTKKVDDFKFKSDPL